MMLKCISRKILSTSNYLEISAKTATNSISNHIPEDFENKTVLLFPGQGSQFTGMGKELLNKNPDIVKLYDEASEILKFDLLKECLTGDIKLTKYCQPAVVVTSVAAYETFKTVHPDKAESVFIGAGYSVGEISSIICSGMISFSDGLRLVAARADLMHEACKLKPSGLVTVQRPNIVSAKEIIRAITDRNNKCYVAVHMASKQNVSPNAAASTEDVQKIEVFGGHMIALEQLKTLRKHFRLSVSKPLNVEGAFHTPLMEPCVKPFYEECKKLTINKDTKFPVVSNLLGEVYIPEKYHVATVLSKQLCHPILWEKILVQIFRSSSASKLPSFVELGPGSQLSIILTKYHRPATASRMISFPV